ncbi:DsbE family thiol:disulfide interchange protein [Roseovarius sp.]|jgi:cytochrome c biogenesis protein CcmG/thiol:disulfide interchange protein DsbE|uniref:DsbE family thiol:disulfide interchange protein n=1 Tax=Roseovarius sp. TaxID=1486281 RepID=UPI0026194BEE|nr:DsbE family thiol:disulfide interchange protein [Roseovarius sp.]MDM8165301.1 DsbE family thiol:disulfide interchange protein [Roseovarius sp.]
MAKVSPLMLAPPVIFAALAALFYFGMQRENPDDLPSTFIGREAPPVPEGRLEGRKNFSDVDLREGQVTVVNFWASWCPPCRAEHPTLHRLAEEGIQLYGINFKDETAQANGYLDDDGNPFLGIAYDPKGRTAIDWGVTAPPETFIIGGDGTVLYKFIGPLVGSDYEQRFRPELEKALEAAR